MHAGVSLFRKPLVSSDPLVNQISERPAVASRWWYRGKMRVKRPAEGANVVSKHRQRLLNGDNPYIRTIILIDKVSLTRVF